MNEHVSRRGFIKTAGVATGVMIATRFNPLSYAANEKVSVASIGVGNQGTAHLQQGLAKATNLQVVAVCDVYSRNRENAVKLVGEQCKAYADYRELLDKEQVDGVVIATPFYTHYPIVMDCLDKGIHVFCEKTMCQTIEQCRDVVKKCHDTGLFVQVGHQRRYNPKYNKAMWLAVDKNLLGRVTHMTAQWHRNSSWRRPVPDTLTDEDKKYIAEPDKHFNWRLYQALSGGLMTELATHQLDIMNWFMGSPPARVAGLGCVNYWRDGRDVDDSVSLLYEWEINPRKAGFRSIVARDSHQKESQLDRPYKVGMTYSSICANSKMDYSEHLYGDKGAIDLSEGDCKFFPDSVWMAEKKAREEAAKKAHESGGAPASEKKPDEKTIISPPLPGSAATEGLALEVYSNVATQDTTYNPFTPNHIQFQSFADDIIAKRTPKANQIVGLHAAISGLKGIEALAQRGTVEIDPALYAFDFETPDPFRYEFVDGPIPGAVSPEKKAQTTDAISGAT